jgi:thiol-disulfide isomerase/thioredoxin
VRFLATVAILSVIASAELRAQDVGLNLGVAPASAVVQDTALRSVDITATYAGKRPVLYEFWATWCENCAALLPRMEAAYQKYSGRVDFVVVGVGVNQTLNSMKRHLAQHPLPFRFYYDNTGAAVRAFEAPATSYIVVLNAQGRVVYTGLGPDQDIDAALRRGL